MIEKLLEFLKEWGELCSPLVMVHPWEGVVITRAGKYNRTKDCGYWWKWPVYEDFVKVDTCMTTIRLVSQSLTTKDDIGVIISAIVKYQIRDLKAYVCDVYDQKDVLGDVTLGTIGRIVKGMTYKELMEHSPEEIVITEVRKEVNKFGFQIHKITFADLCKSKSMRLIQSIGKDSDF